MLNLFLLMCFIQTDADSLTDVLKQDPCLSFQMHLFQDNAAVLVYDSEKMSFEGSVDVEIDGAVFSASLTVREVGRSYSSDRAIFFARYFIGVNVEEKGYFAAFLNDSSNQSLDDPFRSDHALYGEIKGGTGIFQDAQGEFSLESMVNTMDAHNPVMTLTQSKGTLCLFQARGVNRIRAFDGIKQ